MAGVLSRIKPLGTRWCVEVIEDGVVAGWCSSEGRFIPRFGSYFNQTEDGSPRLFPRLDDAVKAKEKYDKRLV